MKRESSNLQKLQAQKQEAQEILNDLDEQKAKLEEQLNDIRQKCTEEAHLVRSGSLHLRVVPFFEMKGVFCGSPAIQSSRQE